MVNVPSAMWKIGVSVIATLETPKWRFSMKTFDSTQRKITAALVTIPILAAPFPALKIVLHIACTIPRLVVSVNAL